MLTGAPLSAPQRMRFFRKAANARGRQFDTQNVYTFTCFQHVIDLARRGLLRGAVQPPDARPP